MGRMSEKRTYRKRKRAQSEEETRRRIVEATMALHQEIGPRATSISAIAERAGVQRLTVYRHFPDETAVFQACTSHWLELNPPPTPDAWEMHADPWARAAAALGAFYAYYVDTAAMWRSSHRDVEQVPALRQPMAQFAEMVEAIAAELAAALPLPESGKGPVSATLAHALAFPTWADLEARALDNAAKVNLVCAWLRGLVPR